MTVLGCDVAFYENRPDGTIDFVKMKEAGMKFTIIRAGQNLWVDPKFHVNWQDSKKAGLPRGSYWFYDSRVTPQSQAKLWIDNVKMEGDSGELPLFADYEENYGGAYKGGANFKIFLEEVKRLLPGKEIIIYTGYWYWKDNVSITLHSYFIQYKLWIANYGVTIPSIPAPWTTWTFWQYSEDGTGSTYGCAGGLDMDLYNGTLEEFYEEFDINIVAPPPTPSDDMPFVATHEGVVYKAVRRFGANCVIHIIDPKLARIYVTPRNNYGTVKKAVAKYSASGGFNGGGWTNYTPTQANEVWVSDGNYLQLTALDDRPFINVSGAGVPEVRPNDSNIRGLWNTWGFDRLLLINGQYNTKIGYSVKDARTGAGVTAFGKLVFLSVEGNDRYNIGLNFPEMASVLLEFGAVNAGNCDGGSSSQVINTAISPDSLIAGSDGQDANVYNQVLFTSKELGGVVDPPPVDPPVEPPVEPPVGETMKFEVVTTCNQRKSPTMYEAVTIPGLPVGTVFTGLALSQVDNPGAVDDGVVFVQNATTSYWMPMVYNGKVYNKSLTPVVIPPPPVVPVVPNDGNTYGFVNLDYDQLWADRKYHVSRPTRNNAPRSIHGLPATARFAIDKLVVLTPDIQDWMHKMCWGRVPSLSDSMAKRSWASMTADDRFITNKTGSDTYADYINRTNLDKMPMRLQPMACGGTYIKITGSARVAGIECWEIEAINSLGDYRQYSPEAHPYLFYQPTNSVRVEINNANGAWTGKYRENKSDPFPQYANKGIIPIFAVGSSRNYIDKTRVRILKAGEPIPSPFVP